MWVDAHQHFWRLARNDYGWLNPDDHPAIYRDFAPADLEPLLRSAGVERTILVQAAPTLAETDFLLELAAATPFVAGVVGWVALDGLNAGQAIESRAKHPAFRGLRPMLQDLDDDAWILGPAVAPALDAIVAAGLTFDALVKPRHLPHITKLLERRPTLRLVVDHAAKPSIASGDLRGWREGIVAIGRQTSAFCKLSGLVSEAGPGWRVEDLRPFTDVLLDAFGPARLMWGSDWPVVNEAGGYAAWRSAAEALVEGCSPADRDLIFGGTAERFYGIEA